jgi:hypothetical protein
MSVSLDTAYFREKVRICLRLAERLPWNSPTRYQFLLMAEDFQRRERELDPVSLPTSRDLFTPVAIVPVTVKFNASLIRAGVDYKF